MFDCLLVIGLDYLCWNICGKIYKLENIYSFMGKVVGVISLKGGVGKTSSVVSLGAALADIGKKILLVDGNFSAPNLGLHLDVIDPEKTIHHVLSDEIAMGEAVYNLDNFDIIPASVFHGMSINPMKLKNKLRSLKNKYDLIILDSSPRLDDETLAVMSAADELLVVTTPDYSTLSMTLKSVSEAKRKGTPIVGLILNKVYDKKFELGLDDIERTAEVPVMAVIPHDVNILRSQAYFTPHVYSKPKSVSAVEYKKLAAILAGEKYQSPFSVLEFLRSVSPQRQEINREIFYESLF
jgi:septum site-determining protein MinD